MKKIFSLKFGASLIIALILICGLFTPSLKAYHNSHHGSHTSKTVTACVNGSGLCIKEEVLKKEQIKKSELKVFSNTPLERTGTYQTTNKKRFPTPITSHKERPKKLSTVFRS